MPLNSIAWIGRLTGPKGEIAQRIVNEVAPRFPDIKFTIVGGPENEPMRKAAGNNVAFLGFVEDVTAVIESHDLVIGAGRVALEAMRKRVPVIAVGESQYIGPISEATVNQAKASNFGDCAHPQPWTARQMADDISRIARGELSLPLAHYAEYLRDYAADEVYGKVLEVYRRARIDAYLGRYREIPVLTYHRIPQTRPSDSKFNIYVTVDELDWQIKNLKQRGFEFITFNEIADGVQVKKPVILTFDDGYEDNYQNLLPLLKRHDAKAVIYALGDRAIRNNRWDMARGEPEAPLMNDEQLIACHRSGQVEVGSHGMSHRHLPQLTVDEALHEIQESKRSLENLLGAEIVSFAYPYGDCGARETEQVRQAGYLFGIATVSGPTKMADDLLRVRRITMFPNTKAAGFFKKTSGWYLRYCKLKGKDF